MVDGRITVVPADPQTTRRTGRRSRRSTGALAVLSSAVLVLAGCGTPSSSEISSALQADGLDADAADCFAEAVLDADVAGQTLDVLAEDGAVDGDGASTQIVAEDVPTVEGIASDCELEPAEDPNI